MKILNLIAVLVLCTPLAAFSKEPIKLRIPAKDILKASREITPQTGPGYSVEGTLECLVVSQEFPPYSVNSKCEIIVDGVRANIENPEKLIGVLQSVKPMTGPVYSFTSTFKAISISQEVPPYKTTERAEVLWNN